MARTTRAMSAGFAHPALRQQAVADPLLVNVFHARDHVGADNARAQFEYHHAVRREALRVQRGRHAQRRFEMQYSERLADTVYAEIDVMKTIRPEPCSVIQRAAACVRKCGPLTLVATSESKLSSVVSSKSRRSRGAIPALLTSRSRRHGGRARAPAAPRGWARVPMSHWDDIDVRKRPRRTPPAGSPPRPGDPGMSPRRCAFFASSSAMPGRFRGWRL